MRPISTRCWPAIRAAAVDKKRQQRLDRIRKPPPQPKPSRLVTEEDCQRLEKLAQHIASKTKSRRGWQDHRWIFPHRQPLLHKN